MPVGLTRYSQRNATGSAAAWMPKVSRSLLSEGKKIHLIHFTTKRLWLCLIKFYLMMDLRELVNRYRANQPRRQER